MLVRIIYTSDYSISSHFLNNALLQLLCGVPFIFEVICEIPTNFVTKICIILQRSIPRSRLHLKYDAKYLRISRCRINLLISCAHKCVCVCVSLLFLLYYELMFPFICVVSPSHPRSRPFFIYFFFLFCGLYSCGASFILFHVSS